MNPNDASQSHSESLPNPGMALASAGFPRDLAASQQGVSSPADTAAPATVTGDQQPLQAGTTKVGTEQWISAARNIIDSTSDDPYAQTELLYELRTQFMQQVHSRSLKQKDPETK